jgi:hypothetical protein
LNLPISRTVLACSAAYFCSIESPLCACIPIPACVLGAKKKKEEKKKKKNHKQKFTLLSSSRSPPSLISAILSS